MARIRTIKPSFFQSDDVSVLPLRARLTWIGLWTQCDDAGRTKDHARLIKAAIWPLDNISLAEIEEDLATLHARGRIVRYEVDGQHYLEVTNWSEHQAIQKKTPSRIPPPTAANGNGSGSTTVVLQEVAGSTTAGKGREGKGREGTRARGRIELNGTGLPDSEPPLKCEEHTKTRNPPNCGACADARKRRDEWRAQRDERVRLAAKCRLHRGELAHNCRICAAEELNPGA